MRLSSAGDTTPTSLVIMASALLVGCKKPPEAPAELDELCAYLYDHVDDQEPDAVIAGIENLASWLEGGVDDLNEGYTVDNLYQSTLDGIGPDRDSDAIIGAAIASTTGLSVEQVVDTLILADPAAVYIDTYASYERTYDGDPDCFVSQDCDWLEMNNKSVANLPLSIELETEMRAQERWVETDLGPVMVHRAWLEQPSEGSTIQVKAQYHLAINLPWNGGLARVQAMWADMKLVGISVPEASLLNMLVENLIAADQTLYEYTESN